MPNAQLSCRHHRFLQTVEHAISMMLASCMTLAQLWPNTYLHYAGPTLPSSTTRPNFAPCCVQVNLKRSARGINSDESLHNQPLQSVSVTGCTCPQNCRHRVGGAAGCDALSPTLFSSMHALSCSPDGHSMTRGSFGASGVTNLSVTVGSVSAASAPDLTLLHRRGMQLAGLLDCTKH